MAIKAKSTKTDVILELEKSTGLKAHRIAELIDYNIKHYLLTWHPAVSKSSKDTSNPDPETSKQIENAWLKIFGYPMGDPSILTAPAPLYNQGMPGQGKTAATYVAMEIIAKAMGKKLHINPHSGNEVNKDDLLLVLFSMGGEISAAKVTGIPDVRDGYSFAAPPIISKQLREGKFSTLILDDLVNAHPGVQNSFLGLITDGALGEVNYGADTAIGGTGNLGKLDGTNTYDPSSALLSRFRVALGYDPVSDFCARLVDSYGSDSLGTMGLEEFLTANPDIFSPLPSRSGKGKSFVGNTPNSRQWSKFIGNLRAIVHSHYQQKDYGLSPEPILPQIVDEAHGLLGEEAANRLSLFYSTYFKISYPASTQLLNAKLSPEMRNELASTISKASAESNQVASGFLSRVVSVTSKGVFDALNQKDVDTKLLSKSIKALCEASFTCGYIKSNKSPMVGKNMLNFARQILEYARVAEKNDSLEYDGFGSFNENGEPRLSSTLINGLVTAATKFNDKNYPGHGEALVYTKAIDGSKLTAVEDTINNTLTGNQQIEELMASTAASA